MSRKKARPLSKKAGMTLANIPVPDFLKKDKKVTPQQRKKKKEKHQDAYEEYAKWYATPSVDRDPPTKKEFMKLWKLPYGYVYKWEDDEEFLAMVDKHFWKWLYSKLPDIAEASFQRAIAKTRGSAQDTKILLELIGKRVDINKPAQRIQPFMLVGVDHDKIEELFTPPEYIEAAEVTMERQRKRHSTVDDTPKVLNTESA